MVGCMNRKRWEMQSSKKRRGGGSYYLLVYLSVRAQMSACLLVLLPSYHLSVSLSVCLSAVLVQSWL